MVATAIGKEPSVFKEGTLVAVSADENVEGDSEFSEDRITAPADMHPVLAEAFKDVQQAQSRLLRGHHKAAVEFLCDAVNRIAQHKGIHGYATY